MKKLFILSLILTVTFSLHAQKTTKEQIIYETNFENDWSFIEFDPPEGNIWQIGTPSKDFLDSAYSSPFALMTDTANLLYEEGEYSFILKAERPEWSNCIYNWIVDFKQSYSFDSLYSGGIIEISYDKGESWINFVNDTLFNSTVDEQLVYTLNDTLNNGIPALTGTYPFSNITSSIGKGMEHEWEYAGAVYSVWVKFTYINLRNNNPHEGWLIDNLGFMIAHWCEFIDTEELSKSKEVKAYPNPVHSFLKLKFKNAGSKLVSLKIFNINGICIEKHETIISGEYVLDTSGFASGIYYYLLFSADGTVYSKDKFIVL